MPDGHATRIGQLIFRVVIEDPGADGVQPSGHQLTGCPVLWLGSLFGPAPQTRSEPGNLGGSVERKGSDVSGQRGGGAAVTTVDAGRDDGVHWTR